jgi:hypothetical protein
MFTMANENRTNGMLIRLFTSVAFVLALGLLQPSPIMGQAQLPVGTTVTTTFLPPVTQIVADPLTGLTSTQTIKETTIELKHEDMFQYSMCTEEPIKINGKLTVRYKTTTQSDGRVIQEQHEESNGRGDGILTSARYTYNMTNNSQYHTGPMTGQEKVITVIHENIIRQGEITTTVGGDDQWFETNLHVTYINGQPFPTVDKFQFVCR